MPAPIVVPRIAVSMVSDDNQYLSIPLISSSHRREQKQVSIPPKILITPAQDTTLVWYDEDSSESSSDSDEEKGEEEEEESYRPKHLTPPPTMTSHHLHCVGATIPSSPFSPLRNSFTSSQIHDEGERTSPVSSGSLPEDKKGLDKDRFDGLLKASRERRAQQLRILAPAKSGNASGLRVQTSGLGSAPRTPPSVTSPNPRRSASNTMDLRKEITLRACVAKHEHRRQSFLARLLASPSSSPTTLTTPVTPPESPAEFHFTLPSPGLVSPLALFESISIGKSPTDDWEWDDDSSEKGDLDRVEMVDWREEMRVMNLAENEPMSPAAKMEIRGMGVKDSLVAQKENRSPLQQKTNRLPIGVGRLQLPVGTGRPASTLDSKVVVPPRRGASLGLNTTPTSTPFPPSTAALSSSTKPNPLIIAPRQNLNAVPIASGPRPRHPPSLNEITARINASKAAANPKHTWGGDANPRSRALVSSPRSNSNARAAAFPDFLRRRSQEQSAPMIPLSPPARLTPSAQGRTNVRDASVLVVPPSRPKSVDAVQERLARGSMMMEKLSLGHRRRKSEDGTLKMQMATRPHRAVADGWF